MPKLLLAHFSPPLNLPQTITDNLSQLEAKSFKERLVIFSAVLLISLGLLVPALLSLKHDLNSSGLVSYLSLVFSDSSILLSSFKEFWLSILESLPVFSLGLAAVLSAFLLWSSLSLASLSIRRRRGFNLISFQ